ncbi:MAG: argininosuccinate lyase [Pyrinomonadaceae bacterium]
MTKSGQLWGGRFTGEPDAMFAEFNDSFRFDRRLFAADVRASIAHANGLGRASVLDPDEVGAIVAGLSTMLDQAASDPAGYFDGSEAEDVHSFIEGMLVGLTGDAGRKLHTGRSRNDQVATAFRLWLREEIDAINEYVRDLQSALVDLASRYETAVLPGYTHLQRAQPVMWAHWCLAYFEMLRRDRDRLADARKRTNILPLGSAALAGTSFPIDREAVAAELGFDSVSLNSLDAVADRDFAVEFTAACSLIMVHLSRMAEDLILYCSTEFGFIELSDAVSSGSSLMPQKKNPDALELIRGKAGRVFGHQTALLATLKGLPLAYNKDMQEDKEAVFDTSDTVSISLRAAAMVLANVSLNEERMRHAAMKGYLNATELADYLVRKGVPFRSAHETVGRMVLAAIGMGKELHELSVDELQLYSPVVEDDIADALGLDLALSTKGSTGGTSPVRVAAALAAAREYLKT